MKLSLRHFNNFLTVIVVSLGSYLILAPLLPQIAYFFSDKSPAAIAPYAGGLASSEGNDNPLPIPEDNRLVIPGIGVNEPIFEGDNIWVINNGGTWRRPNTSYPTDDNNTVIVGHRFYGNNTSTFYNLDKVELNEKLALYWEGEEIIYEVTEITVVDPSAVEIEAPTTEKQLTLYTCTPIWTAKDRLVIVAVPVASQIEDSRSETEES